MKILQVIPGVSPRHGGPSVALTDMTRLLCERGADTIIMTTNTDPQGRWDVALGRFVEMRGARILYYNIWPVNRWAFSVSLFRALLREMKNYDVVHIYWLYNFSSLAAAIAARRAGVPYVFQPNGSLDPNLMQKNRCVKEAYIRVFGNYILKHASGIVFASPGEKRIARMGAIRVPTHVVPVGLHWSDYANLPEPGLFRRQFPELAGKRIVLFLSRISRQKGIDLLIPAFRLVAAEYPDAHLVLAGPDGEGYGVQVKQWVATAGIESRVTWAGRVPDELKLAAYVDSELFVLPSHAENFGAVVTEAMACQRPVVISNCVNICDEVAAGSAGVVVETTIESVAAGIMQILRNPAQARQLGANGRTLVQRKFTWDVALARLIPLYQQLADANPHRQDGKV
jgi:glycosyltransferase involved in cell wall biosynthesis